jgi:hypothetical protein
VPELAGHVQAVKFDPDTGQLDIVPEAPAYGTKLRWTAPKLIAQANQQVKGAAVRTIHVLPPSPRTATSTTAAADPEAAPAAAPTGPVRTRDSASAGYRRALEAHQHVHAERRADPAIAAAVERQDQALRKQPSHWAVG